MRGDALQVPPQLEQSKAVGARDQRFDPVVLTQPEFEQQVAARPQPGRRAIHQPLHEVESVGAAVKGDVGFVVTDFRLEAASVALGDIGRIARDHTNDPPRPSSRSAQRN